MIDPFGRHITYLRLSVTDRCDLRCTYCMAEKMTFLPKKDVLTLEELDCLASTFIDKGVSKLRITGGEPLVRKDIRDFLSSISRHLDGGGLNELTLTTNGTQLSKYADDLAHIGIKRINVSLDTIDPAVFASITRGGKLSNVLDGLQAAKEAGLAVKINTVALKNRNAANIKDIIRWAHNQSFSLTLIEAMPLGVTDEDRMDHYLPLSVVREELEQAWRLRPNDSRTGGPARYVKVQETGGLLGFITPLTNNFCDGCNRVRVTCTGKLYLCLGQAESADLREVMRNGGDLNLAIDKAIGRKPQKHEFEIKARGATPAQPRHMSVTGG